MRHRRKADGAAEYSGMDLQPLLTQIPADGPESLAAHFPEQTDALQIPANISHGMLLAVELQQIVGGDPSAALRGSVKRAERNAFHVALMDDVALIVKSAVRHLIAQRFNHPLHDPALGIIEIMLQGVQDFRILRLY